MQEYVCGFLFFNFIEGECCKTRRVLLIEKTKPQWQKGLYNGIGGKIEEGETPHDAMVREFFEEADLSIPTWDRYAEIINRNYVVHFFRADVDVIKQFRSKTEEQVKAFHVNDIPANIVGSNRFLIPLAQHKDFSFTSTKDIT